MNYPDLTINQCMDMTMDVLSDLDSPSKSDTIREEILIRTNQFNTSSHFGTASKSELNTRLRKSRAQLKKLGFVCNSQGKFYWSLTDLGRDQLGIGKASKVLKLRRAWLVTWSGTDSFPKPNKKKPLIDENNRIVSVVRGNMSSGIMLEFVKCLYSRAFNSVEGMVWCVMGKDPPPIERVPSGFTVGYGSLFLHSRIVTDLTVLPEFDDQFERIRWTEPDYWQQNSKTYQLELIERGKVVEVRRRNHKVGYEPFGRRRLECP